MGATLIDGRFLGFTGEDITDTNIRCSQVSARVELALRWKRNLAQCFQPLSHAYRGARVT
jgi:hypothetical protein